MLLASHAALVAAACGALALAAQHSGGLWHSVDSVSSAVNARTSDVLAGQQAPAELDARTTYDLSHPLPNPKYTKTTENASLAAVVNDVQLLLLKDDSRNAKHAQMSALMLRAQQRFEPWSQQLDGPRGSKTNLIYKNLCDIHAARIDIRGDGTKQTVKDIFEGARAQNADFSLFTSVRNLGTDKAVEKAIRALHAQLVQHCGVEIKYLKSATAVSVASAATARTICNRNTEQALRAAKNRDAYATSLEAVAAETVKVVLACLRTIYKSRDKAVVDYRRNFTDILQLKQSPASNCPKEVLVANVFNAIGELRVVLQKNDEDWKASMLELDKSALEYGKIVSSLYDMHPPNYNLTPCFSANDKSVFEWEDKIHQVIDSLHTAAKKVAVHMQTVLAFTRIYYVFVGWLEMLVYNFWTLVDVPDPLKPISSASSIQMPAAPLNISSTAPPIIPSSISAASTKMSKRKIRAAKKKQLDCKNVSADVIITDDESTSRADREITTRPLTDLPQDMPFCNAILLNELGDTHTGWHGLQFDTSVVPQSDTQPPIVHQAVFVADNIDKSTLRPTVSDATDKAFDYSNNKPNEVSNLCAINGTFDPTRDEIEACKALWDALSKPNWAEDDRVALLTHITVVLQKLQKQMEKVFKLQCKKTMQRKALESEGLAVAETIKNAARNACHVHLSSLSMLKNKSDYMLVSKAKTNVLVAEKTVAGSIKQISDIIDRLLISGKVEQSLMCVLALLTQSTSFFTDAKVFIATMRSGDTIAKGLCDIANKSNVERLLHLQACAELNQEYPKTKADLEVVLDACRSWNDVMEKMSALTRGCFELYESNMHEKALNESNIDEKTPNESNMDEKVLNIAISKCKKYIHTFLSYEPSHVLYCQRRIAFLALQLKHVVTQYCYELCGLADTHEKVLTKLVQIPYVEFLSLVPQE